MQLFYTMRQEYLNNGSISVENSLSLLKRLKHVIQNKENDIYDALYKDLNKSSYESYISELGIVYNELNYFIKNIKKLRKRKKVKTPLAQIPSSGYIYYDAYGVVLILSPWNYPVQLTLAPLVSAIACGNRVIIKPSEYSVNTSNVIKEICDSVFKEDICKVILGDYKISEELLKLKFDKIFFTGSTLVGKKVMEAASKNLVPVTLELGGKSPAIILDGNLDLIAKRLVFGKFLNAGQTCVAPDYILIKKELRDDFLKIFVKHIRAVYSDYINNDNYPKIISEKHFARLVSYINEDNVYYGGNCDFQTLKIEPTILVDLEENSKVLTEEIFGPIMPIVEIEDHDDAINYINLREKPLALYIFSKDKKIIKHILNLTSSGGVCINDTLVHLACHNLPFGGVGASGMGNYHGKHSFYCFSHEKSVLNRKTYLDINLRYQPYNKRSINLIKKIMK